MAAGTDSSAPVLRRLVRRPEFLRASKGLRAGRPAIGLQAVGSDEDLPGVGITVTKKVGNAPERNRVKRRLRAAIRTCAAAFQPRHDYVLVGRRETLGVPFATLAGDIDMLLKRIHDKEARERQAPTETGGSRNEAR